MFAITSKYYGPTERRGSCVIASHSDGGVYSARVPYDAGLSAEKNHEVAFFALVDKLKDAGYDLHEHWASWTLKGSTRVWVPVLLKTHDNIVQVRS